MPLQRERRSAPIPPRGCPGTSTGDGEAEITIGEQKMEVKAGEVIVMPAGIPHALYARKPSKMLLIGVFNP
ncbi:cupin domain-containing protein [Moorellaceae bacterium AZ2]